eukprot:10010270-Lingulodinium_polyedra.AAC.1
MTLRWPGIRPPTRGPSGVWPRPARRVPFRARVVGGVFFVREKSGKLRLIYDARRCNRFFRAP